VGQAKISACTNMIAIPFMVASWVTLATYCGYALVLAAADVRTPMQRIVPRACAIIMLASTAAFLLDQNFLFYLGTGAAVLSVTVLALLFASIIAYRSARDCLGRRFGLLSLLALAFSFVWFFFISFFLPLMWFPAGSVVGAHLLFALVFAVMLWASIAWARRASLRKAPANGRRPWFSGRLAPVWFLVGGLFIWFVWLSPVIQTRLILRKREHTMQVYQAAIGLAAIARAESPSADDSIYPGDLGIKTVPAYLDYLSSHHLLDQPLGVDPSELSIGNVSWKDPDNTIFIRSTGDQLDIHSFVHNLGGVPHYAHGFVLMQKSGKGDFYRNDIKEKSSLGVDVPRTPAYLSPQ
jgi:hypothetical protein